MDRKNLKIFIPVLVIVLIVFLYKIINAYDNSMHDKESINNVNDKYIIKIEYPIVHEHKLDNKIDNYIKTIKKDFLREAIYQDNYNKYALTMNYFESSYKDIKTVHLTGWYNKGKLDYDRFDKIFNYDMKHKKMVSLKYFFDDMEDVRRVSMLSYSYLSNYYYNNNLNIDDEVIRRYTSIDAIVNSSFKFDEDGLTLLFDIDNKSISIKIPYSNLNDLLKSKYKGIEKDYPYPFEQRVKRRDIKQFEGKKLIAFTFDDGPGGKPTKYLLDNLDKRNARVTFFVLGNRVMKHRDIIYREYMMGNSIGNHSYSHKNLVKLKNSKLMREIEDTNMKVKDVTGVSPILMRPPYGSFNKKVKNISNMSTILWSVDTMDWFYHDKKKVSDAIVKKAHDGDIVLLHDLYQTSVEGAIDAMDKLAKKGYAFVTIDELARLKGKDLKGSNNYYKF